MLSSSLRHATIYVSQCLTNDQIRPPVTQTRSKYFRVLSKTCVKLKIILLFTRAIPKVRYPKLWGRRETVRTANCCDWCFLHPQTSMHGFAGMLNLGLAALENGAPFERYSQI